MPALCSIVWPRGEMTFGGIIVHKQISNNVYPSIVIAHSDRTLQGTLSNENNSIQ